MATMMLRGAWVAVLIGCVASSAGCDGGFDAEEANDRCAQEREARERGGQESCMTAEAYDQCLDAFSECGEDVFIEEKCPTTFTCLAD